MRCSPVGDARNVVEQAGRRQGRAIHEKNILRNGRSSNADHAPDADWTIWPVSAALRAVYETLTAWDFLTSAANDGADLELPKGARWGQERAILGAGVAGLCAAYELDRAGYECAFLRRRAAPAAAA